MPNESPLISVVIPCRNEVRHIRACLESALAQELGGIQMEVLVADGMSDDGTREILAEFTGRSGIVRVVDNPSRIVSTGMNRAIREARGEIILRMDAHTLYAPDYARTCVAVLNETNADNVGGPALTRANGYFAEAIAHAYHTRFASGGARFHNPHYEGPADTVPYGCWRKSTLERLGSFDERLVRGQDDELNVRLAAAGGTVWQSPRIVSWYTPRATLSSLFRQYFQYGFWKLAVIRKHRRVASWRNLVPGLSLVIGASLLTGAVITACLGAVVLSRAFMALWTVLAACYVLVSLAFAVSVARKKGWTFSAVLPFVFATYHLGYALGFLLGLMYRPAEGDQSEPIRKALTAITR